MKSLELGNKKIFLQKSWVFLGTVGTKRGEIG